MLSQMRTCLSVYLPLSRAKNLNLSCGQQLGKVGTTAFLPLPQPPKGDEFLDRIPRSLRKVMNLRVGLSRQSLSEVRRLLQPLLAIAKPL